MFNQKKFCYKKCFASNNDDSKTNEMLYSVKLSVGVVNGLDFTLCFVQKLAVILADKSC